MTLVWIGLALAALMLFNHLSRISSDLVEIRWPDEVPVALHEERARDQHITHLVRLLAADDPTEAHQVVRRLVTRIVAAGDITAGPGALRLDNATRAFLDHPPLHSPTRYRRELDAALTRIEAL